MDQEVEKTSEVGVIDQPASHGIFAKHPALKVVGGIAAFALIVGGAMGIREALGPNLDLTGSSASCYGYNCSSSVLLSGRVVNKGYGSQPFSSGVLRVAQGSVIELTWSGSNVDRCTADWTRFKGTYMPPTQYQGRFIRPQEMTVTCFKGRNRVYSSLTIIPENRPSVKPRFR